MVVATLVVGCTTDQTETPPMVEVGDIEVTYSVDGEEKLTLLMVDDAIPAGAKLC